MGKPKIRKLLEEACKATFWPIPDVSYILTCSRRQLHFWPVPDVSYILTCSRRPLHSDLLQTSATFWPAPDASYILIYSRRKRETLDSSGFSAARTLIFWRPRHPTVGDGSECEERERERECVCVFVRVCVRGVEVFRFLALWRSFICVTVITG